MLQSAAVVATKNSLHLDLRRRLFAIVPEFDIKRLEHMQVMYQVNDVLGYYKGIPDGEDAGERQL